MRKVFSANNKSKHVVQVSADIMFDTETTWEDLLQEDIEEAIDDVCRRHGAKCVGFSYGMDSVDEYYL